MRLSRVFLWFGVAVWGQQPPAAEVWLNKAYDALRVKDYDAAVAAFSEGIRLQPERAGARKDLAYTLLKIGENEAAREQFAEAYRLDAMDLHAGLEFAFLAYETGKPAEARRTFDHIRGLGAAGGASAATAATAFENIDRPLREGIARWREAVAKEPGQFSAHEELAKLAEIRDELELAAEHYEIAWRLRPDIRSLMLDLGRVWKAQGKKEPALALLLAASRGAEPRTAERALELLPRRYPYPYEFVAALKFDPACLELRREYAYLLLAMNEIEAAVEQFRLVLRHHPAERLSAEQLKLLGRGLSAADEAIELGDRSFASAYLRDALRYYGIAQETDPEHPRVNLKLGYTYNMLRQDREALRWFARARSSTDAATSREATRAYRNLAPQFARVRTTTWMFPFYSSRWNDVFAYAQTKVDFRIANVGVRPYVSTRLFGDVRRTTRTTAWALPAALSENSVVLAAGVATEPKHNLVGWFEAGTALAYLPSALARWRQDYRGGVAWSKGWGALLGGTRRGRFVEASGDAVYVSRFEDNVLFYPQARAGYTFAKRENGFQAQAVWHWNLTLDTRRQYWANTFETGPGVFVQAPRLPSGLRFGVHVLQGVYTVRNGNPASQSYTDVRVGAWYAFTR